MTDPSYQQMPDDAADRALERRLARLGPLMRDKARAEADLPDEMFLRDLEDRLVRGDEAGPVAVADAPGDCRRDDTLE